MDEVEFIDQLTKVPFSHHLYSEIGLDDEFIEKRIMSFNPNRKTTSSQLLFVDDALIRLVNNYDVSQTEIGMVCFGAEVIEAEDYFLIGKFEAEFLAVSKFSKEVVVLSFDDLRTLLMDVLKIVSVF